MTLVDWIIVAILAGSVWRASRRDFSAPSFSLGGLILGLVLAAWNYNRIARFSSRYSHSESRQCHWIHADRAAGDGECAALLGSVAVEDCSEDGAGLSGQPAGALFGFFQGVLLVTVCILVTVAFFPETDWLTEARLPRYFFACLPSEHPHQPDGAGGPGARRT